VDEISTPEQEATGVKESKEDRTEHLYELDLEDHGPEDIDAAFKDAVAAVDRTKEEGPSEPASAVNPPSGVEPVDDGPEDDQNSNDQAQLASEATGLRERLMRTLADFDNYRKRTDREKQALRRFANFDVFKDFLGVLDNFERAMESSGSTEDLKQGLKMIVRQQEEILRRHGVESVEAVGQPFDPTVHEAVAREESIEVEKPTVTKVLQKGYLLHDRLLRPAMVYVAMPTKEVDSRADDTESGEASG